MYSTNNSSPNKDYIYCRNDCGARITFSNNAISRNGRKIPLQENGLPHNCPKSHFYKGGRQKLPESTEFVREVENTEHQATIVPTGGSLGSNPKQDENSDNFSRKITSEQHLYADTIGPSILRILSLVQKIYEHTVKET